MPKRGSRRTGQTQSCKRVSASLPPGLPTFYHDPRRELHALHNEGGPFRIKPAGARLGDAVGWAHRQGEGENMRATGRILMLSASGLFALALSSTMPGGTPAAAQAADEPVSKTCREGPRSREIEIQKIEPFKVFDNLYHVGPCYVSVWLLTTPQGVIMFDTTQEPFVDKVIDNIKKVGVNLRDIKYILVNHGHLDHAGGAARFQE